jgi:hypothetical protein
MHVPEGLAVLLRVHDQATVRPDPSVLQQATRSFVLAGFLAFTSTFALKTWSVAERSAGSQSLTLGTGSLRPSFSDFHKYSDGRSAPNRAAPLTIASVLT